MVPNRHEELSLSRLLATVVRQLLKVEQFETLADLTEALKCRCATLRIPWTNDAITDAYHLIDTNTPLLKRSRPAPVPDPDPVAPVIDHAFASRFLQELRASMRRMP